MQIHHTTAERVNMSIIYEASVIHTIENNIKLLLNEDNLIKERLSRNDHRSIGNIIEEKIKRNSQDIFPKNLISNIGLKPSKKSMSDLICLSSDGYLHNIDVKTHMENTTFNMPNITSVEKLIDLYKSDKNYFSIILVKYMIIDGSCVVSNVIFSPIENISIDCLTIGALGKGQLQLKNSNSVCFSKIDRNEWIDNFKNMMSKFYDKQIIKFTKLKNGLAGR